MKHPTLFRILFVVTLLPFLASCQDTLPTGFDSDSIMPLAAGNRWIGKVQEFDRDGNQTGEYFDTIMLVRQSGDNYFDSHGQRYWYDNDTLNWEEIGSGTSCPCPRAIYPASRGEMFGYAPPAKVLLPDENGGAEVVDQIIASTVTSTDTLVTVPAGQYHAYHYQQVLVSPQNAEFMQEPHSFFAPGVGPVRIDMYYGNAARGKLAKRWELIAVTLQ